MHQLKYLVAALALTAAACNNSSTSTTAPTTTAGSNEFSQTLTQNGAWSFPFAVLTVGTVTATLVAISPDSTAVIGLGLGIWDGTACQSTPGLSIDKATTQSVVTGSVTAAGNLCVRVYDSTGSLPQPETFDVQVVHP